MEQPSNEYESQNSELSGSEIQYEFAIAKFDYNAQRVQILRCNGFINPSLFFQKKDNSCFSSREYASRPIFLSKSPLP